MEAFPKKVQDAESKLNKQTLLFHPNKKTEGKMPLIVLLHGAGGTRKKSGKQDIKVGSFGHGGGFRIRYAAPCSRNSNSPDWHVNEHFIDRFINGYIGGPAGGISGFRFFNLSLKGMEMGIRIIVVVLIVLATGSIGLAEDWSINTQEEWSAATGSQENLTVKDGIVTPSGKTAIFKSKLKTFSQKRSAASIVFDQSPIWQNWNPIPNLGPSNLADAPVLLSIGPDNYWMFGRYGGKRNKKFVAEDAKLEGFNIPLKTTPFPNQYDAPGGLMKGKGGYHAWQSRDMVNWVHHGPITEGFSRWVTSAEYVNGKTYIYYDYPNDQDPHVYVDEDLTDGKPGKNLGMAFKDPSHGSDAGFIRDTEGKFHVIYEDWSPINASRRSWDSPLAGHAVSKNGVSDYKIVAPAIDNRTKDTGKVAEYRHPHWKQHPKWDTNIGKYNVHEPEQEAYGDWAAIAIGGRYYLFGDYDPVGGHAMACGWFTAESIDKPFKWCDKIGKGHPDPDICFAEGKFYLATQMKTDYTSPGPWVEKVEARVGVDTDNDGKVDQWTDWTEIKETYVQRKGFAKQIDKTDAAIDLKGLPAGHAFGFEFKITDTTENKSMPMMDRVTIKFK